MADSGVIKNFIDVYEKNIEYRSIEFNGSDFSFQITGNNYADSINAIKSIFSNVDILPNNNVSLKIKQIKVDKLKVFYRSDDYLKRNDFYLNDFDNVQLLILEDNQKTVFKDIDETYSAEKSIIFNGYNYQRILNYFKSCTLFSTINNIVNNEFIVVSKENGVMHIGFKNYDIRVSQLDDLAPVYELLKQNFEEKKGFIQFFKETISEIGLNNNDSQDRFFHIVKDLRLLLALTERDHDNYLLEFSFENIRTKFKEERNKYFEGLEKNIDLISKQVVSFPLTFAATAFASYQVKDKPLILVLIFIAYTLYTFIASKTLNLSSYNIECLENDIKKEETSIKNNYSKNYKEFQSDFEKIKIKTDKIKSIISTLKLVLSAMITLFFLYTALQIFSKKSEVNNNLIQIPVSKIQYIIVDSTNSQRENNFSKKEIKNIKSINRNLVKEDYKANIDYKKP